MLPWTAWLLGSPTVHLWHPEVTLFVSKNNIKTIQFRWFHKEKDTRSIYCMHQWWVKNSMQTRRVYFVCSSIWTLLPQDHICEYIPKLSFLLAPCLSFFLEGTTWIQAPFLSRATQTRCPSSNPELSHFDGWVQELYSDPLMDESLHLSLWALKPQTEEFPLVFRTSFFHSL